MIQLAVGEEAGKVGSREDARPNTVTPAKAGVQSRAERGIEEPGFLLPQE